MGRRGAVLVLKYVHRFKDRHGKVRHYFRRNGRRIPLPGEPGSAEFADAYSAALAGKVQLAVQKAQPAGTFASLAVRYYQSPKFLRLSASSRSNYRRVIDGFLEEHGHRLVSQVRRVHVDAIIGAMADRPGAAIVLLKRLRTLLSYAVQLDWIEHNPAMRVEGFRSNERHTWTEAEIAQFERHWPIGTKQRLAFALLLWTGQRGSDVHRMTWPDENGLIHVVQQKTKARLEIPVAPELAAVLAVTKREHITILITEYGSPFSVKGFGQTMSAAIRAAGLPERCKAHGLRKALARRAAEGGATPHEIGAVTGHKTLAEVERYTRAANQERLAQQAMNKIGKP